MDHPKKHSLFGLGLPGERLVFKAIMAFQGRAFWNFGGVFLVGVFFFPHPPRENTSQLGTLPQAFLGV